MLEGIAVFCLEKPHLENEEKKGRRSTTKQHLSSDWFSKSQKHKGLEISILFPTADVASKMHLSVSLSLYPSCTPSWPLGQGWYRGTIPQGTRDSNGQSVRLMVLLSCVTHQLGSRVVSLDQMLPVLYCGQQTVMWNWPLLLLTHPSLWLIGYTVGFWEIERAPDSPLSLLTTFSHSPPMICVAVSENQLEQQLSDQYFLSIYLFSYLSDLVYTLNMNASMSKTNNLFVLDQFAFGRFCKKVH